MKVRRGAGLRERKALAFYTETLGFEKRLDVASDQDGNSLLIVQAAG